jgi:Ca2+-binding RTX toxin-like protein
MRTTLALSLIVLFTAGAATPVSAAAPTCAGRTVTVRLGAGQHPTDGNDVILGTPGADVIRAGAGTDYVCGRGGDDELHGARGADRLYGELGSDEIFGGPGNDRLFGGAGGDYTGGNAGFDHCDVGPIDPGNEGDPSCETGNGAPDMS